MNNQNNSDDDLSDLIESLGEMASDKPKRALHEGDDEHDPRERAVQVISAVSVAKTTPEPAPQQDDLGLANEIKKTFQDFDVVGKELLDNYRSDRKELQATIDHLGGLVTGGTVVSERSGQIPGAIIEGWVKAQEVKANLAGIAMKLLDSKTRLLAAMKASQNIQNTVHLHGSQELTEALSNPVQQDLP